jgi:hypothetical protein
MYKVCCMKLISDSCRFVKTGRTYKKLRYTCVHIKNCIKGLGKD